VEQSPRIAAVIVTYNSTQVLGGCLRSLADQRGTDLVTVVVADNASSDGSLDLAASFADVLPIRTVAVGSNAGYSAGINAGIETIDLDDVDAVLVLNPDCRIRPEALARLAAALREPGRGIAVARLIGPSGVQHYSLRREPSVRGAFSEAITGGHRAGRRGGRGEMITDPAAYERPGAHDWATGAAMLISTAACREIGPWDESFFLYSEETEYALRACDRGWTLWYEPAAVVEHIGGESKTNLTLAALLVANKVRLFRRRNPPAASAGYWVATLLGQSLRAIAGSRSARAGAVALLRPSRGVPSIAGAQPRRTHERDA